MTIKRERKERIEKLDVQVSKETGKHAVKSKFLLSGFKQ